MIGIARGRAVGPGGGSTSETPRRESPLKRQRKNPRPPSRAGLTWNPAAIRDRLLACDLIIRSPGVPGHLPILEQIHRRRIPIWSELELAARYTHARHLVAITGTNGKTTTTTLVGELFKATGRKTFVAGNIGLPLSDVAQQTTSRANVVLEVSSYQLEDIAHLSSDDLRHPERHAGPPGTSRHHEGLCRRQGAHF